MGLIPSQYDLARMTTVVLQKMLDDDSRVVVLLPVGSVEPHGPHLPLATDTVISQAACARAAELMAKEGIRCVIAPPVPYGVTNCAHGFAGAITVGADSLTTFLGSIVSGFLEGGFVHVCLVNNHLEPAQDAAIRAVKERISAGAVSIACPLTRRWARTLSPEFKSGACHAGKYETSIIQAADGSLVNEDARIQLPEVPISLSEKLLAGVSTFREMGMSQSYAGDPAGADSKHGDEQLELLATMIVSEVLETLT